MASESPRVSQSISPVPFPKFPSLEALELGGQEGEHFTISPVLMHDNNRVPCARKNLNQNKTKQNRGKERRAQWNVRACVSPPATKHTILAPGSEAHSSHQPEPLANIQQHSPQGPRYKSSTLQWTQPDTSFLQGVLMFLVHDIHIYIYFFPTL